MYLSKKLIPAFLLLFVYFIADELLPPLPSILCILSLGIAEFLYTRFKEKEYNWLTLGTTHLFCLPGIFQLLGPEQEIAFFKTGITEAVFCLFLGIFAFSRIDLSSTLPAEIRKNVRISAGQQKEMSNILRLLFYLLCFHTLLVFYALLYAPTSLADFIAGPLLYGLLGLFFLGLLLRRQILRRRYRKEEWLPVVDEKGTIIGKAPRSLCHSGEALLHPVVHLHILNSRKEIFLQKRSQQKELLPGMWDSSVGGHVGLHEKIEEALKRETFEELGITEFEADFLGSYIWESPREKELVFSFICTRHNSIHIDRREVEEGRFWTIAEIETALSENCLTPNFIHEYRTFLSKL